MLAPRKIVLHMGWPKTGTTTLQRHVLPRLNGYRYLGKTPFTQGKNTNTFHLVHLLAYASQEQFNDTHLQLLADLQAEEHSLFGNVDPTIPLIISEEGILSSLLKPSLHQHHGISTASLEQIMARLLIIEKSWNTQFDILLVDRDPTEILHAYYAQMFHIFNRIPGLGSFRQYVAVGTGKRPMWDLGFRYLRPGYTAGRLREQMGAHRIFNVPMKQLFTVDSVQLTSWYPAFPVVQAAGMTVENKRSISNHEKLSHLRPIWSPKKNFSLRNFIQQVRHLHKVQYAPHDKLEVIIRMESEDKEKLQSYLSLAASIENGAN